MEIPAISRTEKATLGTGYDTRKEEFVGQCVQQSGDIEFVGNQEANISFERTHDESTVAKEMGFEIGAKVRYGLYSGSLSAKFASSSSASEFSDVTLFSYTANFKNAKFHYAGDDSGLTGEGKVAKGNTEGPFVSDNWPAVCGDEFVSQISLGAKLLFSVKIEFATREDKQSFTADFSLQGPPLEVQANLKTASSRFGKRASLSIQAYQLGGDVSKLSNIFSVPSGHSAIITASMDDPKSIIDVLDALVKYSSDDFSKQISPTIPLDSPIGPAHLTYITSPYQELGLLTTPSLLKAEVELARRTLSEYFEKNAKYQSRLSQLLNGPIRLSPNQLIRFKKMQGEVTNNLALIHEAALVSYTDFMKSTEKVNEITPQLKDYTPEEFDLQPESFAQWWDMKDLPGTLIADKEVIDGIADLFIRQFNDFEHIEDKGLALQQQIATLTSLSIFYHTINDHIISWFNSPVFSVMADSGITKLSITIDVSDLTPLKWLPKLEELQISDAAFITDIEPLKELKNLKTLRINGSPTDLGPLSGLINLTSIKIEGNKNNSISDLNPLKELTQLLSIQIFGNNTNINDITALRNMNQLKNLRIDNASIEDLSPLSSLVELEEVVLLNSPVRSVKPVLPLTKLSSFNFGSLTGTVEDIELLAQHPKLGNTIITAKGFNLAEEETQDQVVIKQNSTWTRRTNTNIYDTVTTLSSGETYNGIAALIGVSNSANFGLSLDFLHQRNNKLCRYGFSVNTNSQPTLKGWWMITTDGITIDANAASGESNGEPF